MRRSIPAELFATLWLWASIARALGPHEILLLVNRNSERSMEVANGYAALRGVPSLNIVLLDVPTAGPQHGINPAGFREHILDPARAEVQKRRIADHILAWVYAPDFPAYVTTDPPISLTGATWVRGDWPDPESVKAGSYRSSLFAGPDQEGGPFAESHSLEYFTGPLGKRMPLPSMMIGWTGARGQSPRTILDQLAASRRADGNAGRDPIWFATNTDVRTTCRSWQFAAAKSELVTLGRPVEISAEAPRSPRLGGIFSGEANITVAALPALAPGGLADNLTSFGATFQLADQTKVTDWLNHGASAAAGAVTEPYAIWAKFPNARLFAHYERGCTALESYTLSIRSPLQSLVIGDPLSAPGSRPLALQLRVDGLTEEAVASNTVRLLVNEATGDPRSDVDFLYLLDHRSLPVPPVDRVSFDTKRVADGWHEIRVIAYRVGTVRHQSFAITGFEVRNRGRGVRLEVAGADGALDLDHLLSCRIIPEGEVIEVAIIAQERVVARQTIAGQTELKVDPRLLGVGTHELQAVAVYPDREAVRSKPVRLDVARLNRPPALKQFITRTMETGALLAAEATDPEGDRILAFWMQDVFARSEDRNAVQLPDTSPARVSWERNQLQVDLADQALVVAPHGAIDSTNWVRLSTRIQTAALKTHESAPAAGLAFNVRAPDDFDYLAWFGASGCWAFGRCRAGIPQHAVTWGAPDPDSTSWREVEVQRTSDTGLIGSIDGQVVLRWPGAKIEAWAGGVVAGEGIATFDGLRVSPPVRAGVRETSEGLQVESGVDRTGLSLRVSDGRAQAAYDVKDQ